MTAGDSAPSVETEFTSITEGQATILFPKNNEVFYNPVQQFNRDLSIAVIRQWAADVRSEHVEKSLIKKSKSEERSSKRLKDDRAEYQKQEGPQSSSEDQNESTESQSEPSKMRFRFMEALSASGLRSIRYAKEMPELLECIVANDLSQDAVMSIERNIKHNGLSTSVVQPNRADAIDLLYQSRHPSKRFHVVDLDPYGTASPFLDGAVQAVADGGLLCVTCTDLAVLAGKYPETCYAKYGGVPVKAEFCHEMALRLVLHAIQTSAIRYRRHIVPILSCSIDFYVRVFVRVYTSPLKVKSAFSKSGLVAKCSGCNTFKTTNFGAVRPNDNGNGEKYSIGRGFASGNKCEFCDQTIHMGGPFYTGPLHDEEFVKRLVHSLNQPEASTLYGTHSRMLGMMTVVSEELNDVPLYYEMRNFVSAVRCTSPSIVTLKSAILNAGYSVSISHCSASAIKTNAPPAVLWAIMKQWVLLLKNEKERVLPEKSVASKLMSLPIPPDMEISFAKHPDAEPPSRQYKLVRFECHKGLNWGPKARAKKRFVPPSNGLQ